MSRKQDFQPPGLGAARSAGVVLKVKHFPSWGIGGDLAPCGINCFYEGGLHEQDCFNGTDRVCGIINGLCCLAGGFDLSPSPSKPVFSNDGGQRVVVAGLGGGLKLLRVNVYPVI